MPEHNSPERHPSSNVCPITGEPFTMPGQTVALSALVVLKTETNDIVNLMALLDQRLAGEDRPTRDVETHSVPSSRPPINIPLLAAIDDHRDTIRGWALDIMAHVNPSWRMPAGHQWATVEAIYEQHLPKLAQWEYAPLMVRQLEDALDALKRLAGLIEPPTFKNVTIDDLPDKKLTAVVAANAVQHITGRPFSRSNLYNWERAGKLEAYGDPKKYSMRDILALIAN